MKQLLVFPLFLTAVVALPLLGKEQCAKGPKIWCQNIHTASQCGAVKHCWQTVWSKPTIRSIPCDVCKEILTMAEKYLKDNNTEKEIVEYFDKACELFPSSLASECKSMVESYLPILMGILRDALSNPADDCSALGLCKSLQQHLATIKKHEALQSNEIPELDLSQVISPFLANVPLLLYPQDKPEPESQGENQLCKDCVQFITETQQALKSNGSFEEHMINQFKKQCDSLPPSISVLCKDYISQYSELAVEILLHMEASDICINFGFCSTIKSVPLQTLVPAKVNHVIKQEMVQKNNLLLVKDSPQCVLCEFVIEKIVSLLDNNRTEENIKHALEYVCSLLPDSMKEQCTDFVDDYADAIIKILLQEASPRVICCTLGVCSNKKPLLVERITPERLRSGEFCKVCKLIVNYLDVVLENNSTEKKIEDGLHRVCNFLPPSTDYQCNQLVTQYTAEFLKLLLVMIEPDFVCSKLDVCKSLGSDECVRGPSYWCKTMETAARCNAVEHCKHHVWN
ncbi:prosaposin isoform X2 [Rhinatrema bivittatum]|uniref:prosaposin isoform X2 n=1 Tax=Rhinatrema bivittatum TaxID=194408 RepID=UPI00112A9246|nr:prosaposin isoform X2 [Rhinatrema bivittatum]